VSELADEVAKVLGARRKNKVVLTGAQVDEVLDDLNIPTSASKGTPVHLRMVKVAFNGTKRRQGDPAGRVRRDQRHGEQRHRDGRQGRRDPRHGHRPVRRRLVRGCDELGDVDRLRLEAFTVSQNGRPVQHKWASYVNALWMRPKYLKSIVGKEATLSTRLMQMFIGADWVPVLAAAATVAGTSEAERAAAEAKTKTATDAVQSTRVQADKAVRGVRGVKAKIAALPAGTPDPARVASTNVQIAELARQLHGLETQLMSKSVAAGNVRRDLKAAKARHQTEHEHALLTTFFHQMEPAVCPRCTAGVTLERRAAEPDEQQVLRVHQ
jgi:hypothetical protein